MKKNVELLKEYGPVTLLELVRLNYYDSLFDIYDCENLNKLLLEKKGKFPKNTPILIGKLKKLLKIN